MTNMANGWMDGGLGEKELKVMIIVLLNWVSQEKCQLLKSIRVILMATNQNMHHWMFVYLITINLFGKTF